MHILYIITRGEEGGAQRHVRDLTREMVVKGHTVSIAVGRHDGEGDPWLFKQLKDVVPSERLHIVQSLAREISSEDVAASRELMRLVKTVRPDCVHLHSTKAGILGTLASWRAGVPVVYTVHGFVFNEPMSVMKKCLFIFAEWFASWFRAHTIVLSDLDARIGLGFHVVSDDRLSVIYNGIDPLLKQDFLDTKEARNELQRHAPHVHLQSYIFGTVANLYPTKGLDYYLESIAIIKKTHPKVQAIIVGEGPERARLTALRSKLDLEDAVALVGHIPDAYKLLRAFDCFVLPSVKEGAPYVLLEAALSGIPSVATEVGGVREMANKAGCITLVPPKNPKALAEVLAGVLEHGHVNTTKEWHPALELSLMVRATEGVYKEVLKEKNS